MYNHCKLLSGYTVHYMRITMTLDQTVKLVVCDRQMRRLILDRMQNYTNYGFCGFVLVIQVNIRIFSEIRPRLLSSTFLSIRYSQSFRNLVNYVQVIYSVVK
jgi:hypothetical protein